MSKQVAIARYGLIISRLRKSPASFAEIQAYLDHKTILDDIDYTVSLRTFQRDVKEILSLYNIDICYDFSQKIYTIDESGIESVNEAMLASFDLFNTIKLSQGLEQFIQFEKRVNTGSHHLLTLLQVIKKAQIINFEYQKFDNSNTSQRTVEPYALKEFRYRWYLLAKDNADGIIKTFGLDRMSEIATTNKKYAKPDTNLTKQYFNNCYGVTKPNNETPTEVVLSFTPLRGKYIKTLPLHASQETIIDNEKELRIKLNVYITYDLEMDLVAMANDVTVIKPKSLINKLKKAHHDAYQQY